MSYGFQRILLFTGNDDQYLSHPCQSPHHLRFRRDLASALGILALGRTLFESAGTECDVLVDGVGAECIVARIYHGLNRIYDIRGERRVCLTS